MKTIRMPKLLLAKWLAALRSGDYVQTTAGAMRDEAGYCCLGVLVDVSGDDVMRHLGTPAAAWMRDFGVEFSDNEGEPSILANPYLPTLNTFATKANDDGMPFAEIADAIEACAEAY